MALSRWWIQSRASAVRRIVLSAALAALALDIALAEPPCPAHWRDTGFKVGLVNEIGGFQFGATVYALGVHVADGAPSLVAGGSFTTGFDLPLPRVGRWADGQWNSLGAGFSASVQATAHFDGGSGDELVVGGAFTKSGEATVARVARWNGTQWLPLGGGVNATVLALATFDDGSGPALYAAGEFTQADGSPANHIARWSGSSWSPLASLGGTGVDGVDGTVRALAVFDDGSGPRLFVGGDFLNAGGQPAKHVAAWNGRAWSVVGPAPAFGLDAAVNALAAFDSGSGPKLVAGAASGKVHSWNGAAWSQIGSGNGAVLALHATTFNGAPALLVGGQFYSIGAGVPMVFAPYIARFDGTAWKKMGYAGSTVRAITSVPAAPNAESLDPTLYIGGSFATCDGGVAEAIARWNGEHWVRVAPPLPGFWADNIVYDATTMVVDGELTLVVAGVFQIAGGESIPTIATWRNGEFAPLGEPLAGSAYRLFPSTRQPGVLYAVGSFEDGDGLASTAFGVMRWDGAAWVGMARITSSYPAPYGYALIEHDDGSGPALYLGGTFDGVEGVAAPGLARFDGTSWSPVGGLFDDDAQIWALAQYDSGDGPRLYAAGGIYAIGGVYTPDGVVKWDGVAWSSIGLATGIDPPWAMHVHDDGSGAKLYIAGDFGYLARWDGRTLENLGSLGWARRKLITHDFGSGPRLLVAGFQGTVVPAVSSWNGTALAPVPGVISNATSMAFDGAAWTLASLPDGRLVLGGQFRWLNEVAGTRPMANLALYDPSAAPWIVDGPDDVLARAGETVVLAATLFEDPPTEPVTYQWRRDGAPLVDDAHVSGAASAVLVLAAVGARDVGAYDVLVGNDCGASASPAATLKLTCAGDVNRDGAVDGDDLGALLASWGTADAAMDLTGDGIVDAADLAVLIAAWGGC